MSSPGQSKTEGSATDDHPVAQSPDGTVEAYLADARRHRSAQLRRPAWVLIAGAIASLGLVTRMSDIGHAVGFAGLGLVLLIAAGVLWWHSR